MKTLLFIALSLAGCFFLTLFACEGMVRYFGYRPFEQFSYDIRVEPGNRVYQKNEVLGYGHIPGKFRVMIGGQWTFEMTHDEQALRVTSPEGAGGEAGEIWIFGCSFTHGWSVNDEESFPWLLQSELKGFRVVNFGVGGYGTVHSLLQYREALKAGRPALVVLAYADFHEARNTFARSRRKDVAPLNGLGPLMQPYARLGRHGTLEIRRADVVYREFPLMRASALMHFLESQYNKLESHWIRSREVSMALVQAMIDESREREIPILIANIQGENVMLEACRTSGTEYVDISVPLEQSRYNNLPYDTHPSALAHRAYAAKLLPAMRAMLEAPAPPASAGSGDTL